ncbi:hypothetical protein [Halorubrum sp. CSM-61]|uniref:hypothetical protein n=1 Tax=Halorubrum sp. CSM-61 TaxID=2485838 RepID=UPI000F4C6F30|nr:hypothetical protein [Halorubrum sp. CSM-61]
MASIERIALAAAIALLFLVVIAYFARRYLSKGETNQESSRERAEHEAEQQDYSLPLRSKFGQMQRPTQFMLLGACLVGFIVTYEVYSFAKTGSPTQIWYAQQTQLILAAMLTSVGAIAYERKRNRGEGEAHIKFEDDKGELQTKKTIYFNTDDIAETEDGTVIHEYSRNRIFGLYRRAKAIVEDRELRQAAVFRPPDDKIGHLVPEHATWLDDQTVEWRTKGDRVHKAEGKPFDYRYKPPFTLSRREYRQVQNDNEMLRDERRMLETRIANLQDQLKTIEGDLERAREQNFEEVLAQIKDMSDILGNSHETQVVEQHEDVGRSSRSNGETPEALADGSNSGPGGNR